MSAINDLTEQSKHNAAIQAEEYTLVGVLQPRIYQDGDKWCVLYGENLQDGIAGFGETPYRAVLDFNNGWHKKAEAK